MELFFQLKSKDILNNRLEEDLRSLGKSYDEQLEKHFQTSTSDTEELRTEIRALKRLCEEKKDQV